MTISSEYGITVHDWANDVTDAMRAEAVNISEAHARTAIANGMSEEAALQYAANQAMRWLRAGVLRQRFANAH